jgi:ABC-type transport system involved in cytochrome bd biosynthesis fused ATPase/permease subunit
MLPNMRSYIVIHFILAMTQAIYTQAAIIFLGLVPLSGQNWAIMLYFADSQGALFFRDSFWYILSPILAIALFQLSLVSLASALEDIFNRGCGRHDARSQAPAPAGTNVLSVRGLSIDYNTRRGAVRAVRDVSFDVARGETLAIIGESGSGKTTMAVSLIGLSPRSASVRAGELLYTKDGITVDVRKLEQDELREFRWSECAMVFQAALNSFNPVITIWDQFLDTGRAHGMRTRRPCATAPTSCSIWSISIRSASCARSRMSSPAA